MKEAEQQIATLIRHLVSFGQVKVAVSGGVDSMTMGLLAVRALGAAAEICHARSPAVPPEATARVREVASGEGWRLTVLDAGEFQDPDYLSNPYDRCFHCKTSLYSALSALGPETILSGTNRDDLDDYRPGLHAAAAHGVRHPFVECGVDKTRVRGIARVLGYPDLAELPASPCLSSRIETGIPIRADHLGFVHRVETELRRELEPAVVRCRVRYAVIAIQLDPPSLDRLNGEQAQWQERIAELARSQGLPAQICFEPYRMGSAFVAP
jgi:uncharacterized protein